MPPNMRALGHGDDTGFDVEAADLSIASGIHASRIGIIDRFSALSAI